MRKVFFWFIAAMLSVYGAEVFSGSFPFPFWSTWGWFVLMPLYGLHMVVLASVVVRWGRPTLGTLYLAGMLFGLYEAYITKVLWSSPWGAFPQIAGIGIIEALVLVFWWHPLMAFILPLGIAERVLTGSRTIPIPRWLCMFAITGVGLEWLLTRGLLPADARLLSLVLGAFVIAVPVVLWRHLGWHWTTRFQDMAPVPRVLVVLAVALLGVYLVLGPALSPENLPPFSGQIGILASYFGIAFLLVRRLRSLPIFTMSARISEHVEDPSPTHRQEKAGPLQGGRS